MGKMTFELSSLLPCMTVFQVNETVSYKIEFNTEEKTLTASGSKTTSCS